jgi:hypothetical protein
LTFFANNFALINQNDMSFLRSFTRFFFGMPKDEPVKNVEVFALLGTLVLIGTLIFIFVF